MTTTTEYRIREVQYVRLFKKPTGQAIKTEWVIEQKSEPFEGEDPDSYERDCWVQIASGATEQEAKKAFVVWLCSDVEAAFFDDGR